MWYKVYGTLKFFSFYPRDAMLALVFDSDMSVRLSGRPSVTRRYCA